MPHGSTSGRFLSFGSCHSLLWSASTVRREEHLSWEMGKGANPPSCLGREHMHVYVHSEGMTGLCHSPWLAKVEMQLTCKVLWEEQRRGGTE